VANVAAESPSDKQKRTRTARRSEPETPFDDATSGSDSTAGPAQAVTGGTSASTQQYIPFPKPRTYKFDHQNLKKEAQPRAFLEYWHELNQNPELKARITAYLYRQWPVIKKAEGETKNIGVLAEPPAAFDDLLMEHGSGIYKIFLNGFQGKGSAKPLCQCSFQINDPNYPPVVNPKELDMAHPTNKTFIQSLMARGVLKSDGTEVSEGKEDDDMANTAQLLQVVSEIGKQQRPSDSKALEVMAEAAKRGQDMLATSMDIAMKNSAVAATGNPAEIIAPVVAMVRDLMTTTSTQDSQVVEHLLAQQARQADAMASMVKELAETRQAAMQVQLDALKEQIAAGSRSKQDSVIDRLQEMRNTRALMRDVLGVGRGDDDDEPRSRNGSGGFFESEAGAEVLKKGIDVLGMLIGAAFQFMGGGGAGAGAVANPAQHGMPGVPGMPGMPAANSAMVPVANPAQGSADVNMKRMSPAGMLVAAIENPMVNHLVNGISGHDFAAWFLDGHGESVYAQVREKATPEDLTAFILEISEPVARFAAVPGGMERFKKFVSEFFQGPADDDDDDGTPVVAIDGGPNNRPVA
jgi:hypothetical protein